MKYDLNRAVLCTIQQKYHSKVARGMNPDLYGTYHRELVDPITDIFNSITRKQSWSTAVKIICNSYPKGGISDGPEDCRNILSKVTRSHIVTSSVITALRSRRATAATGSLSFIQKMTKKPFNVQSPNAINHIFHITNMIMKQMTRNNGQLNIYEWISNQWTNQNVTHSRYCSIERINVRYFSFSFI